MTVSLSPPDAPPKLSDEQLSGVLLTEMRSQSQSDREVFASLQQELRRIARGKMRSERPDHTLQPTALVNEAYLKFFRARLPVDFWNEPGRALRLVAHAMEQILNDHADAYRASKRGGAQKVRVAVDEEQAREFGDGEPIARLDPALFVSPTQSEEILAVGEALSLLRQTSPRQAQVVQLKFYGGLKQEETAAMLNVSVETVKLDWKKAKAFLKVHLDAELP
jgi:RNA polymerase sigma-70 factor (ECF subfamily)